MAPLLHADKWHQHSLNTAVAELQYEQSTHLVDIISKDEDIRRLRFEIHVLEDDNDELRELLDQEGMRSDRFEGLVNENMVRAEEAEARLAHIEDLLRAREHEIGALEAEKRALQTSAADSETFLTEKLALTRELSVLRPQVQHLEKQAASAESLLTDKLDLQRQLTTIQCELENAKRDAKRAMAKRRNTGVEIAQEEQVDQLKRELAKEKRARLRAEEAADVSQSDVNIDEVRKQLAREKRARQKAEDELETLQENTQVEDVRKDLLKEKKAKAQLEMRAEELQEELDRERKQAARAAKHPDACAASEEQLEELRSEIAKEQKERTRVEKALEKQTTDFETQKATLEEKLSQFRTKLRTTKDKLKQAESDRAAAQEEASTKPMAKAAANAKKRTAAQFDADATTLGTPGDGPGAKRIRKAAAAVGEKSTFSMTPFLNKTASILPEDSDKEDAVVKVGGVPSVEELSIIESPMVEKVAATKQKKQPLATADKNAPLNKPPPRQRKQKPAMPQLELITEEANENVQFQGQENGVAPKPAVTKIKTKTADGTEPSKPVDGQKQKKQKKRKSLVDFATFNKPEEAKKVQSKKNRKLGGLGKTLFDEEEEESAAPSKTIPGRTLLGGGGFGGLAPGARKAGGFLGASKIGSSLLLTAQDGSGFQFSPLKRRRGNLDDTLRG